MLSQLDLANKGQDHSKNEKQMPSCDAEADEDADTGISKTKCWTPPYGVDKSYWKFSFSQSFLSVIMLSSHDKIFLRDFPYTYPFDFTYKYPFFKHHS